MLNQLPSIIEATPLLVAGCCGAVMAAAGIVMGACALTDHLQRSRRVRRRLGL